MVDIFPVLQADAPALMRAAYGLPRGAKADIGILADPTAHASDAPEAAP